MTKEKQVSVKMDVRSAAAVRQVLFDHQKGHSYEFPSERINDIRAVILELDNKIGEVISPE
jgi:hypothetical protein